LLFYEGLRPFTIPCAGKMTQVSAIGKEFLPMRPIGFAYGLGPLFDGLQRR
jgi:hypothetical protein